MSQPIAAEAQKHAPSALIELFEVDLAPFGGETLRLCSSADHAGPVHFGGVAYSPIAIDAEGFERSGEGAPPTPSVRIADVTGEMTALVESLGHPLGARFTRIKTYARYLDSGPEPDADQHFPLDRLYIDRPKECVPGEYYVYELAPLYAYEGGKFPRRQTLRDYCSWIYRRWSSETGWDYSRATCPYVGGGVFDRLGNVVAAPELDQCGKRLSDCRKRFGSAPLPFAGFPGMMRL